MNFEVVKIAWIDTIFAELPDSNSTTIQILVKAWSIYEQRWTNGLSHFLEHMFFKWGKKYTTPKQVADEVDSFGWEFNAFTWSEYAWYYVKCAPDYITRALDVLWDMMVFPQFPKEEMEREKGVVIQEIAMYEDNPQRQVRTKQNERYHGDNSFGWPILGPKQNVQSFTQEDLFSHKQNLYTKDNLIIIVAWSLPNKESLIQQIWDLFIELPDHKASETPKIPNFKPNTNESFYEKWTQQNHLIIAASWFSNNDDNRFAAKILWKILGWWMSSRLFQRIREKKWLCYYIGSTHSADQQAWNFLIYAWMDKEQRQLWKSAIYEEIDTIAWWDISEDEFKKALWSIRWSTQMWIETSDQLADFVWYQYLFKNKIRTMKEILEDYENVTLEQVNSLWSKLSSSNLWTYWLQ